MLQNMSDLFCSMKFSADLSLNACADKTDGKESDGNGKRNRCCRHDDGQDGRDENGHGNHQQRGRHS